MPLFAFHIFIIMSARLLEIDTSSLDSLFVSAIIRALPPSPSDNPVLFFLNSLFSLLIHIHTNIHSYTHVLVKHAHTMLYTHLSIRRHM